MFRYILLNKEFQMSVNLECKRNACIKHQLVPVINNLIFKSQVKSYIRSYFKINTGT